MLCTPQLYEIPEQEIKYVLDVGDNNVHGTRVGVTVRDAQGITIEMGQGDQLASMFEHSARASPVRYSAVDTRGPSVSSSQLKHHNSSQPGNDNSKESQKSIGGGNENQTQLQAQQS
jgi:hypothetical protein